ncbi:hypothetical protein CgunFtcFv8_024065 [Champsocephalus gunnari]|uniref:G-protein coupled receptors family 1 profile domain-containing protein n=1 Tax=Champsocephalus gunnari TaxID=52237 RepID=A0AAN8DEI5_CHAGU|nr:hypothetical protein CgunFtcFv8_024065 [Champsocephalus gunnari]
MTSMYDIIAFTSEAPPSTTEEDYEDDGLMCDLEGVRVFRSAFEPALFWLLALLGGAGNLAVVWIYLNVRRRLKTMTDVFLLNLALSDLLFLVSLPLWAVEAARGSWSFGPALCKTNSALYKLNLFSGTLLLACISADRYVAIVQTTRAQNSQAERRVAGRVACGAVWLLALMLSLPELLFSTQDRDQRCRMVLPDNRTKVLVLALQVSAGFFLPFCVMVVCYSCIAATLLRTRSFQKQRALRVVLAVVLVFVVSQLPYNAVVVAEAAQASDLPLTDCGAKRSFKTAEQVLKALAYLHAGLNPLLYAFMGQRFQRDLLLLLRCRRGATPAGQGQQNKAFRGRLSSTRASVMSDSDTSQALSL